MAQSIKLDDDLYSLLKDLADSECRTVPLEIRFLVQYYKNGVVEEKKEVKPSQDTYAAPYVAVDLNNADKIRELLEVRRQIVDELRPDNIAYKIQKMAVDECWTDEQCTIEADKLKKDLETRRDEITEQLKNMGML